MSDCVTCPESHRVWIELLNSTTKCVVSFAGLGLDVLNCYFKKNDCPNFDDNGGEDGVHTDVGTIVGYCFGIANGLGLVSVLGWGIRRWYIRRKYRQMDDGVSVRFDPIEGFERREPNAPSLALLEPEPEPEPEAAPAPEPGPEVEEARYSCFGRLLKKRTFYQAGSAN